ISPYIKNIILNQILNLIKTTNLNNPTIIYKFQLLNNYTKQLKNLIQNHKIKILISIKTFTFKQYTLK
ncbi:hypothetical protein, partial [Acinetobacter seifertii]|uniref:hypothetical protein n=1 Tax=Acinetobacter seifertii TaxID=1530123 RepID=UPI001BC87811